MKTSPPRPEGGNLLHNLRVRVVAGIVAVAILGMLFSSLASYTVLRNDVISRTEDRFVSALSMKAQSHLAPALAEAAASAGEASAGDAALREAVRELNDDLSDLAAVVTLVDRGTEAVAHGHGPSGEVVHTHEAGVLLNAPVSWSTPLPSGKLPPPVDPELVRAVRTTQVTLVQHIEQDGRLGVMVGTTVTVEGVASLRGRFELYSYRSFRSIAEELGHLRWLIVVSTLFSLLFILVVGTLVVRKITYPLKGLQFPLPPLEGKPPGKPAALPATLWFRDRSMTVAQVIETFQEEARALEDERQQLLRSEEETGRFVADVSHELRTPMATLLALADVLETRTSEMSSTAAGAVELTASEVRRLVRLTEDLLEISRFDAGTVRNRPHQERGRALVDSALESRGLEGKVEVRGDCAAYVDARRFDVVVGNLVVNALRHGGEPVEVELREEDGWGVMAVTDHGPGIPPEALAHIFERFYTLPHPDEPIQGTGLGLAITESNMRLMGGRIVATSRPGRTTFTCRFPSGPSAADADRDPADGQEGTP